ncbi:Beta-galactosidase 7 [Quaeritorhiza haematococci]|nr:Beta-galactosidase 7 [Quaeritorhiza haematococci]
MGNLFMFLLVRVRRFLRRRGSGRILLTLLVLLWTFLYGRRTVDGIFDAYLGPTPSPPLKSSEANVTYDERAIIVNGRRELLITATIHYPRSSPAMWPHLLARSKAAGANAVDLYIFWNLHEPKDGVFDFDTPTLDFRRFIKDAQEAGLYVVLRIGPYVCAEWNLGGMPSWLLRKPNMQMRTWSPVFMSAMERFVRKVVEVSEPYLASNGGPIILLQMENEYITFEWWNFPWGHYYIQWAANLAKSLDVGVPWFMCEQGNIRAMLDTCNGFYCDERIPAHRRDFPDQPNMFTELWSGWFQVWGEPQPRRPAEDLALSTTRFIAKGGTYVAYYMWHGGTNFGRGAGGPMMMTSYDYDAPLNEYGYPNEPKYSHLQELHTVLKKYQDVILNGGPPKSLSNGLLRDGEIYVYEDPNDPKRALIFLLNNSPTREVSFTLDGSTIPVPKWSATIVARTSSNREVEVLYNTATIKDSAKSKVSIKPYTATKGRFDVASIGFIREPVEMDGNIAVSALIPDEHPDYYPREQIRTTRDLSDYLWYVSEPFEMGWIGEDQPFFVEFPSGGPIDFGYVYLDGQFVGALNHTQKRMEVRNWKRTRQNKHVVVILSTSYGLKHWGNHLEKMTKGLKGKVRVAGVDITSRGWRHRVGLKGERHQYWSRDNQHWSYHGIPAGEPLVWYKLTFDVTSIDPSFLKSNPSSISSSTPLNSFALYLGGMGRGAVFVNGYHIGRYWNITAQIPPERKTWYYNTFHADKCEGSSEGPTVCDYAGKFSEWKCRQGCGEPCQKFYHVPADWLIGGSMVVREEGKRERRVAEVVVLEEWGGDPNSVYLAHMEG